MTREEVQRLLREEEERRRQEVAARDEEILTLMEEQQLDYEGRLWGEESFETYAYENEDLSDTIGRLCPDYRDPEKVAEFWEVLCIVDEVLQSQASEAQAKLFADWLWRAIVRRLIR